MSLVFSPLFCFCCSCSASFKAREIPIPLHPCSGVPMSQLRKEMDENSQQGWCVCNPERVKEKSGKQSCSSNLLLPLALDLGSLAGQEDKSEIQGLPTFFKMIKVIMFSSVQSLSHVRLFVTPWTAAHQSSLSITNSWSLLKLMSIESVMPSNHIILCRPLLLLTSIFPKIGVFSNESALRIKWTKYWSFSFSIIPSNERSGLISFRMNGLDLLAVQGTLKSLLQHHSSEASVFGTQLSL